MKQFYWQEIPSILLCFLRAAPAAAVQSGCAVAAGVVFFAAVFAIVFPKVAEWPIVPVFFAGVFVVFARVFLGKETDLECCLYYLGGALLIQILCWIA